MSHPAHERFALDLDIGGGRVTVDGSWYPGGGGGRAPVSAEVEIVDTTWVRPPTIAVTDEMIADAALDELIESVRRGAEP